jgi:hypothetical protein
MQTTMVITNELLEALLSPDATRRQAAESHFAAMDLHVRLEGLLRRLEQQEAGEPAAPSTTAAATTHLAAVLLRRNLLRLTRVTELQALANRLLSLLLRLSATGGGKVATSSLVMRVIHDCLAQVCASLQILDMPAAVDMVTDILKV